MNDDKNNPQFQDKEPTESTLRTDDESVEARDKSTPAARSSAGTGPGSVRLIFFIAGAIILIFVVAFLTGVVDFEDDAPLPGEILESSPMVETPNVP